MKTLDKMSRKQLDRIWSTLSEYATKKDLKLATEIMQNKTYAEKVHCLQAAMLLNNNTECFGNLPYQKKEDI